MNVKQAYKTVPTDFVPPGHSNCATQTFGQPYRLRSQLMHHKFLLHRKGIADEVLARREEERNQSDAIQPSSRKRGRSVSSSSSSVSTISTASQVSQPDVKPSYNHSRYRSISRDRTERSQRERSASSDFDATDVRKTRARSPIRDRQERRRHRQSHNRESRAGPPRSPRSPRRKHNHTKDSESELSAPNSPRAAPSDLRDSGRSGPSFTRRRSLSPYSKRLALTQAMNGR
ncbi:hypothetical protein FQN57_000912 [Myotisia sp. PD_48]|nr:hypothetical protein FQN57_000912 [Myotisia sp. PD_48]